MKRILHITGSMDRAGAETMVMNLYRAIDRNSYQFDFVYFRDKISDYDFEIKEMGGKIYRIPYTNPLKRMLALIRLLKAHPEYQIVHAHTLFSIGFHMLAAKISGVPHRVAHAHSTNDLANKSPIGKLYKALSYRLINNYSTNFISCGNEVAKFLFSKLEKTLILPNAIDVKNFAGIGEKEKNYLQKEFELHDSVLKIIQVGRLQAVKNSYFSLKIAQALNDLNVDFQLFFIGQGEMREDIEKEIKKIQLESRIKLLGIRSDIPQVMAGADVLLMPSLHEGFPVVLVESQAVGLPALISDSIPSEVDLGVGLVHFESLSENPSVWAEKLINSFKHKNYNSKQRIVKLAEQGFDIHTSAKRLMNLYDLMN